ncbi:hypothetical protein D3C76_1362430 [compost metagenome]
MPDLIVVGRIDEVAAGFEIPTEHAPSLVELGTIAPRRPEITSSERKLGNTKARVISKYLVTHGRLPLGYVAEMIAPVGVACTWSEGHALPIPKSRVRS